MCNPPAELPPRELQALSEGSLSSHGSLLPSALVRAGVVPARAHSSSAHSRHWQLLCLGRVQSLPGWNSPPTPPITEVCHPLFCTYIVNKVPPQHILVHESLISPRVLCAYMVPSSTTVLTSTWKHVGTLPLAFSSFVSHPVHIMDLPFCFAKLCAPGMAHMHHTPTLHMPREYKARLKIISLNGVRELACDGLAVLVPPLLLAGESRIAPFPCRARSVLSITIGELQGQNT